jgi:transcription antitermination protein NusB
MLTRRHLRIKVLTSLYAFFQSMNEDMAFGEKELFRSINKLYEIYVYQLSLLVELVEFAKLRLDHNKQKFFPTEDDLNPSTRFIENRIVRQIAQNLDYKRFVDVYKINWHDQSEMIRKLYAEVRESQDYIHYMEAGTDSYSNDKEILISIIKKQVINSEILHFFYEEKSIYWSDDFYTSSLLVIKTLKSFKESWDENHKLPAVFQNNESGEQDEDREFVKELFRKTILKSDQYARLIQEKAKNWEMDRIAVMDILLLKMALTELTEFQSIPVKVTMNEYIDLAKMYSTPKSKIFVNGILDKLIVDLKSQNKIVKTGRGLVEN